ncbi:MAG: hypothetical protein Ct9H90mP22_7980 [Gammaproteobacteria bacterium]|nr:MAG: hypothetical protein Ct9H90mP22_7980 [Gammaproteobacteria bacterium]
MEILLKPMENQKKVWNIMRWITHTKLFPGIPYYFSKKRKRGRVESYFKGSDQSLWQVSQLFGVQLKSLKKINKGNNSDRVYSEEDLIFYNFFNYFSIRFTFQNQFLISIMSYLLLYKVVFIS